MTWYSVRWNLFISLGCLATVIVREIFLPNTSWREVFVGTPMVIGAVCFIFGVFLPVAAFVGTNAFIEPQKRAELEKNPIHRVFMIRESS